jgi:hypothetical protein
MRSVRYATVLYSNALRKPGPLWISCSYSAGLVGKPYGLIAAEDIRLLTSLALGGKI